MSSAAEDKLPVEIWQDILYNVTQQVFQDRQFMRPDPRSDYPVVRLGTFYKGTAQPLALVCSHWWSMIRSSGQFKVSLILYHNPSTPLSMTINAEIRSLLSAASKTDVDIDIFFPRQLDPSLVSVFAELGPALSSRLRSIYIKGDEAHINGQTLFDGYPSPLVLHASNPSPFLDTTVFIELTNRLASSFTRNLRLSETQLVPSHVNHLPQGLEQITHLSLAAQDCVVSDPNDISKLIEVLRRMPYLQAFSSRQGQFNQSLTQDVLELIPVLPRLRLLDIAGPPSTWILNCSLARGLTLEWLAICDSVRSPPIGLVGNIPLAQQPIVKSLSLAEFSIPHCSLLCNFLNLSLLTCLIINLHIIELGDDPPALKLSSLRDLTIEQASNVGISQVLSMIKMPLVASITTRETRLSTKHATPQHEVTWPKLQRLAFDDFNMAALSAFTSITAPSLKVLDLTGEWDRSPAGSAPPKPLWIASQRLLQTVTTIVIDDPVTGTAVEHLLPWLPAGVKRLRLLLRNSDLSCVSRPRSMHDRGSSILRLLGIPENVRMPRVLIPNLEILEIDGKSNSSALGVFIVKMIKSRVDRGVTSLRKVIAPGLEIEVKEIVKLTALGVDWSKSWLEDDLASANNN